MAQDIPFLGGGSQQTTERAGGTSTSAEPANTGSQMVVSAGAPEQELTDEQLLELIDDRTNELRESGVGRNDATPEGIELRQLETQRYVLDRNGYRGSFTDYINENRNSGILGKLMPIPAFEAQDAGNQQVMMQQGEAGFYNHAIGTPREVAAGVVAGVAEEAGAPAWAIRLLTIVSSGRKKPPSGRPTNGERVNGQPNNRRNPCRR